MAVPGVSGMAAMPAVHEDVKQRTREKDEPRKPSEEMCPMLRYEEESGDREESNRHDTSPGTPERRLIRATLMIGCGHRPVVWGMIVV